MKIAFVVALVTGLVSQSTANVWEPTFPLLIDRVRAFDVVVIASLAEGFEKRPLVNAPDGSARLPLKIEKILKGKEAEMKRLPLVVWVAPDLPSRLADRDKAGQRRYLLALTVSNHAGLGTTNVDEQLERFLPADAAMEKVVATFLDLDRNTKPRATVGKLIGLLRYQDVNPAAARHVYHVLTRGFMHLQYPGAKTQPDDDLDVTPTAVLVTATYTERPKLVPVPSTNPDDIPDVQAVVDAAVASIKAGRNVSDASWLLAAICSRAVKPDDLTFDRAAVRAVRDWLEATGAAMPDSARTDRMISRDMNHAIMFLGKIRDKEAKELLLKIGRDDRWMDCRKRVRQAIRDIFGDQAATVLRELPAASSP